jgi:ABC-type glycerol-3-phosphate transport system permease component
MTAEVQASAGRIMQIVTIGVVAYCLVSVGILWAYARTRLYLLYLVKIAWVGLTIVGFLWIISMSLADPGPQHGGVASEFMKNPAGPFAVVADYPGWAERFYAARPWWLFMLAGLLLLWRGLCGHGLADRDSPRRRTFRRAFLTLTAVGMGALLLVIDHGSEPPHLSYTGAAYFAALCVLWAVLPLARRRKLITPALAALAVLLAAPLAAALAHFDWRCYTYAASNYAYAWTTARMGHYALNSLLVSVLTVAVTSVLASMAAYALTRLEFVGRGAALFLFIGAMVIPAELYIVPLFLMVQDWHVSAGGVGFNFMDSRLGLSLIYAAGGLPFAVFLLTGFYRTLPGTLREAAAIDGCGEWKMFTDVFFPLAVPGLATAAIFQFLGVWNEYQFALVFLTNDKLKTLPVGLYNLSVSQQYAANWSALFAGVTLLCVPTFLIFVLLQERIVAGLTVGGVKE